MNDPSRFLTEESSSTEAELLRSARADGPSAESRRRAAIALGLGGIALTATVGAAAVAGIGAGAAPSGAAGIRGGAWAARAVALKWLGIGIAVGTIGTTGINVARERSSHPAAAPAGPVTPHDSPMLTPPVAGAAVDLDALGPDSAAAPPPEGARQARRPASMAPHSSPSGRAPSASAEPGRPVVTAPADPASAVRDELGLLDRARAALRGYDNESAAKLLDQYDRAFPNGTLRVEAAVLRIDTALVAGDEAATLSRGERFLSAYPNEPQSRHVRDIVERLRAAANAPRSP